MQERVVFLVRTRLDAMSGHAATAANDLHRHLHTMQRVRSWV